MKMTLETFKQLTTTEQLNWLRTHKIQRRLHPEFIAEVQVVGRFDSGMIVHVSLAEAQSIPNVHWSDDLADLPQFDIEIDYTGYLIDKFRCHLASLGLPTNAHFAITRHAQSKVWTLYSNLIHDELTEFGHVEIVSKPYSIKPDYISPFQTHD
jgi:hypothetical protein